MVHPGGRTIGAAEHVWLAWVTHNVSDVHGDAAAAARSEWGEPLVLGMLSAAIVMGLAAPAAGRPGSPAATRPPGWTSIRLGSPVRAGDTLRAESLVEHVEPGEAGGPGLVRRTIEGYDQRDVVVVTIVEERLVDPRPKPTGKTIVDSPE